MAFWVRGMFWVYTSRDIVSVSRKGRIYRNKIIALNIYHLVIMCRGDLWWGTLPNFKA